MVTGKLVFVTTVVGLLAGCATVGSYQTQCESRHAAFPDIVLCLKDALTSDRREPMSDAKVKLYILKADQLSQMVQKGELSDLDARVVLQELYVRLGRDEDTEISNILVNMPKTRTTDCTSFGNNIRCRTR